MRIGRYDFRPSLVPSLVTLVLFPFLISLGIWQLHRAAYKRQILAQYAAAEHEPPVTLEAMLAHPDSLKFRRVTVSGTLDGGHQLFLDNQSQGPNEGFDVLTPLRISGTKHRILIDRGWVPLGKTRHDLPRVLVPAGEVTLAGWLVPPPKPALLLGPEESPHAGWPRIVETVDIGHLTRDLGYPLMPYVVRLDANQPYGFVRKWILVAFGPDRHIGYAVQWFALAGTLLTIYIATNTSRVKPKEEA
ncbi:MAG: hypothetical protein B7Z66_10050 [Chromatiales bacterium 21-64-14]|nr:MAG: hypothetical protein B7Z66_10050 [Chromatiales bacterium 21-64-14]